jgi:cytochrome oxidase Cu insertion factor (SCO1/SenC/PrrC family)
VTSTVALLLSCLALVVAAPAACAGGERLDDLAIDLLLVPLVRDPAPSLALEAIDGTRVALHELRGRPVLLYFWEST